MRPVWVVVRETKKGKQYLSAAAPNRTWANRLGMAKAFFREEDAKEQAAGRYHWEKITV